MRELPVRRSIRLRGFDYRDGGGYFVTICTFRRACVLAEIEAGRVRLTAVGGVVESVWRTLPGFFPHVDLDAYVVMPNHLHGILVLRDTHRAKHPPQADASPLHGSRPRGTTAGSLSAIVQAFKALTTRRVRSITRMERIHLWQPGFYDRVVRDEEEFNRIRRYIEENPLRWALDRENSLRPTV
ncbi:MAG TPA: transposase [Anaerolineales bacterium]|nr:transposase [Anaerolineales bacterium]